MIWALAVCLTPLCALSLLGTFSRYHGHLGLLQYLIIVHSSQLQLMLVHEFPGFMSSLRHHLFLPHFLYSPFHIACMYVCMHVLYVCIYVCICIYLIVYVHMHAYVCMYKCKCKYVCVHIHACIICVHIMCMCIYVKASMYVCRHTCIHVYMCVSVCMLYTLTVSPF